MQFSRILCAFAALSIMAYGQSTSSAKAFFGSTQNGVNVTNLFTPTLLFSGQLKTSNVGSILAGVSMECVLWTYDSVTSTSSTGKNSSSSRATVRVTVTVDGQPASPGQVVYCDRLQALGVTLQTGIATDSVTVELFQATKNANHFNFYSGPLSAAVHNVQVWAEGDVECRNNAGQVVACSSGTLAGYQTGTKVGIGKASMVLEEHNNTNLR